MPTVRSNYPWGCSDVLAIIMAWWITFTIVATISACAGFGPVGIIGGVFLCHLYIPSCPQKLTILLLNNRDLGSSLPIMGVRRVHSRRRDLCNFNKCGDDGSPRACYSCNQCHCGDISGCSGRSLWSGSMRACRFELNVTRSKLSLKL